MSDLEPGDRITIGATHEVIVNTNKSWIKLEINAVVQDGESASDAITRIARIVANNALSEIDRQANALIS